MAKAHEMNLTKGPLLKQIFLYALPLMGTNLLQYLFSLVDIAVLAHYVGDDAVAAVGATTSLVHLLINLFIGISVGTNVILARYVGAKNEEGARKTVGTSVFVGLLCGAGLLFVGFFGARTFLTWMDCDPEVIGMATKYLQIYFLGMPIMMLYNFSSAIMRAVGDTFRPFLFLTLGGVANVGLNILFVAGFHQDVAGVAIATVASQGIAAVLSMFCLFKEKGYGKFSFRYFKIYQEELAKIFKIGIPAGLQATMFSLANIFLQKAVNSFGKTVMAANTVSVQVDSVIFQITAAIGHTTAAFVSQNYGARNVERIKKSVFYSCVVAFSICALIGVFVIVFRFPLFGLLTDDPVVMHYAEQKLVMTAAFQCFYGMLDVLANAVRSLGRSTLAMFVNLFGICIFRLVWLSTAFRYFGTFYSLCWAYPISFVLTFAIFLVLYFPTYQRAKEKLSVREEEAV